MNFLNFLFLYFLIPANESTLETSTPTTQGTPSTPSTPSTSGTPTSLTPVFSSTVRTADITRVKDVSTSTESPEIKKRFSKLSTKLESDSRKISQKIKETISNGTPESYPPSPLPKIENNVFKEFARLSKLTEYMLIDPKFAEDYANDRLTNMSKILYVVYGDVVKHVFASEPLTQRQPPRRRNRIRYRMKSLNDKPPKSCSESGRETLRIFCPFSYGYQWWDCLMPDEVCDGIPHCGLGDDEDPKMCLYFRAAVSKLEKTHQSIMSDIAQSHKIVEKNPESSRMEIYNPEEEV